MSVCVCSTRLLPRRSTDIHLCGKQAATAEMKAIMKRLASGLRKWECRQQCRRLTHICPHSDRSLVLIDWEQSSFHNGSLSPVSLSLYSFFSLSAWAFEFTQFLLPGLFFFLLTFPAFTSIQHDRTEGSLKASQSDERETSQQVLTPKPLTSQHYSESQFLTVTEVTQSLLKMFLFLKMKPLLLRLNIIVGFFKTDNEPTSL